MYDSSIYEIRKAAGKSTYVTLFPDGLSISWRPLSLKDYISYQQDMNRGLIPLPQLEDEIFTKCVIEDSIIRQIPFLKAGIISTVVQNIWEYSGPLNAESFNRDLEMARQVLNSGGMEGIHQLVEMITLAFPYTPEEVYAMDYETFLLRSAQAESKLLRMKVISSPFSLVPQGEAEKPLIPKKLSKLKERIDAKNLWEEQQRAKKTASTEKVTPTETPKEKGKWWKTSPILEAPAALHINFQEEQAAIDMFGTSGHEKADLHINRAKMVEDAQWIYADVIKALDNKKKSK